MLRRSAPVLPLWSLPLRVMRCRGEGFGECRTVAGRNPSGAVRMVRSLRAVLRSKTLWLTDAFQLHDQPVQRVGKHRSAAHREILRHDDAP